MSVSAPASRPSIRKRIAAIASVIAVLAALLTIGGGVASAQAEPTGSISGTVQGAGSPNSNLAGASVFLYAPGFQVVSSTATDEDGNYSFTGVAPGSYTLDFQAPIGQNFAPQWWNDKPANSSADYFSLGDGQAIVGQSAVLAVGSTLSGSVLGAGSPNVPIANAYVSIQSTDTLTFATAQSDADGNFTVVGLAAGTYTAEFSPPFTTSTYISQWWQGQSSSATAQTITVGAQQSLTGFNVVLPLAGSISGSVVGADTLAGVSGATVEALDSAGGTGGLATVAADGSYTIAGLVPGTYVLKFSPAYGQNYLDQYWNNKPTLATADTIAVAGGDALTGINATLAVGSTISGVVTTGEAPTVGLSGASVFAVDPTGQYVGSASTADDGTYTIAGLPNGTYRIQFQPPYGDSHATQFWKNAPTFDKGTAINVTTGSVKKNVNAVLVQGATISGTVSVGGQPLAYADVIAQSPTGTFVTETFADESGNYTLTGLPATSLVVKFAGTEGGALTASWWQNASKLSAATKIKLTVGEALTGINGSNTPAYMTPGHPSIAGTAKVGNTLTAKPGTWKPSDSDTTFTYQWNRDGAPINGATNATYVVANADAGHMISVSVTGDHYDFNDVTATSPATRIVTGGTLTSVVPQITGSPTRGSLLTAVAGTWGPGTVALAYRWSRGGTKISGATGSTYTVTKADAGKQLTVTVTGSETGFTSASQTSAPTAPAS